MPQKKPSLSDAVAEALREESDLRNLTFVQEDAPELSPGSMDLIGCTFTSCHLTDCRFDHTGFQNVVFDRCDLSGSRFFEGGLKDVRFVDCRLIGAVLTDCTLNSVTFSGCGARYLYLSGCTLKNCLLERCMCAGGGLISLKLQKTGFDGCDFTGCDFRSTDLAGCDLSGCAIEGCTWTPELLKNLTVNMQQALELARLLGLNIIP